MLITKKELKEKLEYRYASSITNLLQDNIIVANESGMINIEDPINKAFINARMEKLAKKHLAPNERKKDYSLINNKYLFRQDLSLKAKGLMSLLLSLPKDFNFSKDKIISMTKESKDCVNSTINELKKFGYLEIKKIDPHLNKGKIGYDYKINPTPQIQAN